MATVRTLACIAFRPEALDVHQLRTEHASENLVANEVLFVKL
jgi:hypothetical protein